MTENQSLTAAEAAKLLGISRQRFYQLLNAYPLVAEESAADNARRTWNEQSLIAWRSAQLAPGAPTKEERNLSPQERLGIGLSTRYSWYRNYVARGAYILANYPSKTPSEEWGAKARRWISEYGAEARQEDLEGVWDVGYMWGGWSHSALLGGARDRSVFRKIGERALYHYHAELDVETSLIKALFDLYNDVKINSWIYGFPMTKTLEHIHKVLDIYSLKDDKNAVARIDECITDTIHSVLFDRAYRHPDSQEVEILRIFLQDLEKVRESNNEQVNLGNSPSSDKLESFRLRLAKNGVGITLRLLANKMQRQSYPELLEAMDQIACSRAFSVILNEEDFLTIDEDGMNQMVTKAVLEALSSRAEDLGYKLVFSPVARDDSVHSECVKTYSDMYSCFVEKLQ